MIRSFVLCSLLAAAPARAVVEDPLAPEIVPQRRMPQTVKEPPAQDSGITNLGWMIKPVHRGIWIRLPIVDTNPNRGVTVGVMPIWVLQGETDDRIRQIHAPSLTYNKNFSAIPTYRYYYYPKEDASLVMRGSIGKYENEVMGQYEDDSLRGTPFDFFLRVQHDTDAGQRFYGIGPDSPKNGESNYREILFLYRIGVGHPLREGSNWRARISNRMQASKFGNGPIPNLPTFQSLYPGQASRQRQQTSEWRATIDYDSRDHRMTPASGSLLQLFLESSFRGVASMYDYNRWGMDGRVFLPWGDDTSKVFAIQTKFEQLTGPTPPFWLLSQMGGKYSLRAYGEGRYVDRGMGTVNAEQRFTLYEKKLAGVTTEFQLAPFIGAGAVFSSPQNVQRKMVRPVFGGAIRAVAKPQVVGSIDIGAGREGLALFMDINYSF